MSLKRTLFAPVRGAAMAVMGPYERSLLSRARGTGGPACFIVGPPRSGTTLLYEALVTRFRFAYLSNLAHRFYRTPVTATRLGRGSVRAWEGSFESSYGHVDGWGAPNEGGWIWGRWMPEEHALDAATADTRDLGALGRTVLGVSDVLGAPFLNKNVMHSVHMDLLDRALPGCVFVELRRDPAANARSILRTRAAHHGPAHLDRWISVRPRGWEEFRAEEPAVQVAAQVFGTWADVDRSAAELGEDRRITVGYEDFCADPRGVSDRIAAFLRGHGVELEERRGLPESFRSSSRPLDDDAEAALTTALQQLAGNTDAGEKPRAAGVEA